MDLKENTRIKYTKVQLKKIQKTKRKEKRKTKVNLIKTVQKKF